MRDTVRVGSFFGINVGLHWSAAIIAVLFTYTLGLTILPESVEGLSTAIYVLVGAGTAIAFLASIIAHELGHSVVATRNGVGVSGVTLFALGGVARLESEPGTPGAAARIALAGPAVSVAIGVGSIILGTVGGAIGFPAVLTVAVTWLGIVNLVLAVFNMIPALPLDGGRALQAVLWKRSGNRHEATIRAAGLGRTIGFLLIGLGLWQFLSGNGGLWTALIGWFVVRQAKAEAARARAAFQWERWKAAGWPEPGEVGPLPFLAARLFGRNAAGPAQGFQTMNRQPPPPGSQAGYGTFGFGGPTAPPGPHAPPSANDRAAAGATEDVIDVDGRQIG